jgi:hypothetical protein
MQGTSACSIHSRVVEGDRPQVLYICPMDLLQLLRIVVIQNIELCIKKTNIA